MTLEKRVVLYGRQGWLDQTVFGLCHLISALPCTFNCAAHSLAHHPFQELINPITSVKQTSFADSVRRLFDSRNVQSTARFLRLSRAAVARGLTSLNAFTPPAVL